MKINISILAILFYSVLTSCTSDVLTKEKAESIIKSCQTEESLIKTKTFNYGTVEIDDLLKSKFPDFMKPYHKLEKLGIFNIGDLKRVKGIVGKKDQYEITLTSNGKEYLVNSKKGFNGKITGKFKTCEYKFNNIQEIQEMPKRNEAKVKIQFTRFKETPFFEEIHQKRNPKTRSITVTFRKTTDGWKLCDK
ncbi:MAG: hypothetical protein P8L21_00525 [Polaribacter sp.]|uniref:hypothetical protein n=1 Tax=Algibacter sp. TaxID=1872428 RepID=UPI002628CDF9|nr:hypothetical protein [Algibacter sp.]MDG1730961.1 hypothetical protein [Algibacter sp.]MDG2356748.1 hypothetical protein [Polaribacter sp.]